MSPISKKLSHLLLVPAVSLLPCVQALATQTPTLSSTSSYVAKRDTLIRGKLVGQKTIQVRAKDLEFQHALDQQRLITFMDANGVKHRVTLLTPERSQLLQALEAHNGQLKEFNSYKVIDDNGHATQLHAVERILPGATPNQVTLQFTSAEDQQRFMTPDRKMALTNASLTLNDNSAPTLKATAAPSFSKVPHFREMYIVDNNQCPPPPPGFASFGVPAKPQPVVLPPHPNLLAAHNNMALSDEMSQEIAQIDQMG